jgi:hypothetical protein
MSKFISTAWAEEKKAEHRAITLRMHAPAAFDSGDVTVHDGFANQLISRQLRVNHNL